MKPSSPFWTEEEEEEEKLIPRNEASKQKSSTNGKVTGDESENVKKKN